MRKFIQAFAFFTAIFAFGAIAANAQTSYGAEVKIPFAFNVGDRSYDAGDYVIRVNKLASGAATLVITNTETDDIHTVLLSETGDIRTGDVRLVFDNVDGQRYLTGVRSANNTYAIAGRKVPTRKTVRIGAGTGGGGATAF